MFYFISTHLEEEYDLDLEREESDLERDLERDREDLREDLRDRDLERDEYRHPDERDQLRLRRRTSGELSTCTGLLSLTSFSFSLFSLTSTSFGLLGFSGDFSGVFFTATVTSGSALDEEASSSRRRSIDAFAFCANRCFKS